MVGEDGGWVGLIWVRNGGVFGFCEDDQRRAIIKKIIIMCGMRRGTRKRKSCFVKKNMMRNNYFICGEIIALVTTMR